MYRSIHAPSVADLRFLVFILSGSLRAVVVAVILSFSRASLGRGWVCVAIVAYLAWVTCVAWAFRCVLERCVAHRYVCCLAATLGVHLHVVVAWEGSASPRVVAEFLLGGFSPDELNQSVQDRASGA